MGTTIPQFIKYNTSYNHFHTTNHENRYCCYCPCLDGYSLCGDVMSNNGMEGIVTIVGNIDDLGNVGADLNTMEGRLEELDGKSEDIQDVRDALTTAMDAGGITNAFLHENVV